jgi:uncharacterized membrane protein
MQLLQWFKKGEQKERSDRWIFSIILVSATLSLLAAFVLSVENVELLRNPNAQLTCNVNVFLNCASVMKTDESHIFGFPNSFIGLVTEPVLITIAIAFLAGARFKKWFYIGMNIGSGLGSLFAYWLFFQSLYNIQVLCPWCLLVTVCTTIIFEAITRYNLRENHFNLPKKAHKMVLGWLAKDYDKFVAAGWLVLLAVLALVKFPGIFD